MLKKNKFRTFVLIPLLPYAPISSELISVHALKEKAMQHLLYDKTKTSLIILLWKPHLGNPSLPLAVAALSNGAQIDTVAPPPLRSSSLPICVKDPGVQYCSCMFP